MEGSHRFPPEAPALSRHAKTFQCGRLEIHFVGSMARNVHDDLENTLRRVWREIPKAEDLYPWLIASLQSNALHYLGRVLEEVELHIDEPYGLTRAEEDKKLLLRRATSTYGLQATPRPKDGGR